MQYIFNTTFFEAKGITTNICDLELICLSINYPLKMNPLINPFARNGKFG